MSFRLPRLALAPARQLTGRNVLALLVAFFGVVIVINVFMMSAAIRTFGGVDVPSSYEAGRAFEKEVAKAAAQAGRDWRVDEDLSAAGGDRVLTVRILDAGGTPITGVQVRAKLAHPVDERQDVELAMSEEESGVYRGRGLVAAGVWQLELQVDRSGEQVFRSRNRILVP
ncbi:MAG TPA: FixH family protein [Bauldia sp.]|nr:FixH family protein [Bauldia sp.]